MVVNNVIHHGIKNGIAGLVVWNMAGLWLSIQLGMEKSSQLTKSYLQRGRAQPPSRMDLMRFLMGPSRYGCQHRVVGLARGYCTYSYKLIFGEYVYHYIMIVPYACIPVLCVFHSGIQCFLGLNEGRFWLMDIHDGFICVNPFSDDQIWRVVWHCWFNRQLAKRVIQGGKVLVSWWRQESCKASLNISVSLQ